MKWYSYSQYQQVTNSEEMSMTFTFCVLVIHSIWVYYVNWYTLNAFHKYMDQIVIIKYLLYLYVKVPLAFTVTCFIISYKALRAVIYLTFKKLFSIQGQP